MEIGDIIDAKDLCNQGTFYIATIIDIKIKYDEDISKNKKCIKHFEMSYISSSRLILEQFCNQKGILVHYHEWKDKWDDWIYIDDENKIFCDCIGPCQQSSQESQYYHRIVPANTQSVTVWDSRSFTHPIFYQTTELNNYNYNCSQLCLLSPLFKSVSKQSNLHPSLRLCRLIGYRMYHQSTQFDNARNKLLIYG